MHLTVVSLCAVFEGIHLLVEFSDGSLKQYVCYKSPKTWYGRECGEVLHLTPAQIAAWVYTTNRDATHEANYRLHSDKVRRLGHDYAARGY